LRDKIKVRLSRLRAEDAVFVMELCNFRMAEDYTLPSGFNHLFNFVNSALAIK
jgi:hypothetical protein